MNDNDKIRQVFKDMKDHYIKRFSFPSSRMFGAQELGMYASQVTAAGLDMQTTIGGRKGFAKSTMGFWLGIGQKGGIGNSSYKDFAFNHLEKNLIYTADAVKVLEEARRKYAELPRYDPVQIDEAKVFYVRNFMKTENRNLIIWMGSNRKQIDTETGVIKGNKHMIICLDDFLALDSGIRASTNQHIEMISPGLGAVFRPLPIMTRDRWLLDYMMKTHFETIMRDDIHSCDLILHERQLQLYTKLPTFFGLVVCPSMDLTWKANNKNDKGEKIIGEVERHYVYLDGLAKKLDMERPDGKKRPEEKYQETIMKLILPQREAGVSWAELAKLTGTPSTTLQNWNRKFQEKLTPDTPKEKAVLDEFKANSG